MTDSPRFDVDACRGAFPQLADGIAYFENAGGSYVPSPVLDAMDAFLRSSQVQPSWSFASSRKARERVDAGIAALAALTGAEPDELVLGHSTTVNVLVLAQALRPTWEEGDVVIVTNQDHEANGGAWRRLAASGIEVREWKVDPSTGELDPAELARLLEGARGKARLVAFPQVSNVVGSLNDVGAWTAMAHEAGAQVCVDGVAYAPHRLIDVKGWGVNWYVFSAYKVYGPHLGVMVGRREAIAAAANANHYFHAENVPAKLNPGGMQYEAVAACAGIGAYLDAVWADSFAAPEGTATLPDPRTRHADVFDLFAAQEEAIATRVVDYLATRSDVRLIGRATGERSARMPTIAFHPEKVAPKVLAERLAEEGVAIGASHFYAPRVLEAMGLDPERGVARISAVHTNTLEEVERLLGALERALETPA